MNPRLVPGETFRALVRARDLLHARYADALRLDHLAQQAGLSRFHFVRMFSRAFGATPHRYQVELRLRRAKELLRRPGAEVTEVCFETGFSSLGSFSTLFAREFGRPPSQYRREVARLYQVPDQYRHAFVPFCFLHHLATPAAISEKHPARPRW
jgi:AraC-like DNA-binding protein